MNTRVMTETDMQRFIDNFDYEPWKKQLLTDWFSEFSRLKKENEVLNSENTELRKRLSRFLNLSEIIRDIDYI